MVSLQVVGLLTVALAANEEPHAVIVGSNCVRKLTVKDSIERIITVPIHTYIHTCRIDMRYYIQVTNKFLNLSLIRLNGGCFSLAMAIALSPVGLRHFPHKSTATEYLSTVF